MTDDPNDGPRPPPQAPPPRGGLYGVAFVILLVIGAIYLIERMRASASLSDCMFTHDPKCRELIDK